MVSRIRLHMVALPALLVFGCHSGHVDVLDETRDGRMLLFEDSDYHTTYLATAERVRSLGIARRQCYLSPDGEWVLCLGKSKMPATYVIEAGARILLFNTRTNAKYRTHMPAYLPVITTPPNWRAKPPPAPELWPAPTHVFAYFLPGPRVALGPAGDRYWLWHPAAATGEAWTTATPDSFGASLTEAGRVPLGERSYESPCRSYVVSLPTDGWNAMRTVWVLPDGTERELMRQTDAPWRVAVATAMIVGAPVQWLCYDDLPLWDRVRGLPDLALLGILGYWNFALEELVFDGAEYGRAEARLARSVLERRAAFRAGTTAQRSTAAPACAP